MKLALAALILAAASTSFAQVYSDAPNPAKYRAAREAHFAAVAKKRNELENKVAGRVGVIVYANTPYTANALGLTMPCYKAKTEKGETALWYLREQMLVDSLERDAEYARQDERAHNVINPKNDLDRAKVALAETELARRTVVLDAIGELAESRRAMETYDLGLHRFAVKEGVDVVPARCK